MSVISFVSRRRRTVHIVSPATIVHRRRVQSTFLVCYYFEILNYRIFLFFCFFLVGINLMLFLKHNVIHSLLFCLIRKCLLEAIVIRMLCQLILLSNGFFRSHVSDCIFETHGFLPLLTCKVERICLLLRNFLVISYIDYTWTQMSRLLSSRCIVWRSIPFDS